jgi:hypothetical protein
MSASVIPSAKNSCAGSPERLASGRTAIDSTRGIALVLAPDRRHDTSPMAAAVSRIRPMAASTAVRRVPVRVVAGSAGAVEAGTVVPRSDQAESAVSSPARTSPARWYRRTGSFSRHFRMTPRSAAGTSAGSAGVGSRRIADDTSNDVDPSNGRWPVVSSYKTMPSAQMSARPSGMPPWRSSGAR